MRDQEKAFKTYFGGKEASGVYQKIINCIRPHKTFASLFLGNDAVIRYIKPCEATIGIDLDPKVIEKWKNLNIPNLSLIRADGIKYLSEMSMQPGTVIFADPPYPLISRKSSRKVYRFEMEDKDHLRFLEVAKEKANTCDFLICTYENDMYKKALKDWNLIKYTSQTRKGPATEFLYMNYDLKDGLLHDYSYLGEDFIDRQRIKRKINRFVQKLGNLPASEMNAILTVLTKKFNSESF